MLTKIFIIAITGCVIIHGLIHQVVFGCMPKVQMKFIDVHAYKIHIQGQVEEEDISPFSHMGLVIKHVEGQITSITLRTDQSGMIGLIRHLHGLGMVLISMNAGLGNLPENGSILSQDKQE